MALSSFPKMGVGELTRHSPCQEQHRCNTASAKVPVMSTLTLDDVTVATVLKLALEPFDLAAGVMLVRNAGGRVVDESGQDIDAASHAGPFVGGVDEEDRQKVLSAIASRRVQ